MNGIFLGRRDEYLLGDCPDHQPQRSLDHVLLVVDQNGKDLVEIGSFYHLEQSVFHDLHHSNEYLLTEVFLFPVSGVLIFVVLEDKSTIG